MQFKTIAEENGELTFIGYFPNFLTETEVFDLEAYLHSTKDWRGGTLGFGHQIPRLQKWFHEDSMPFAKSWHKQYPRWQSFDYTQFWYSLQNKVISRYEDICIPHMPKDDSINHHPKFNSILVNYYRNGNDSIKAHRDSQPEFGDNPTILCISLGQPRKLVFKRVLYQKEKPISLKTDKSTKELNCEYLMEPGSLIVMAGSTQKYFCHEIPKDQTLSSTNSSRFSLTFREHR
tara:strand:- start:237 stop:932 length:696 start_codon:yes stop_codon:yes gene_type:complete